MKHCAKNKHYGHRCSKHKNKPLYCNKYSIPFRPCAQPQILKVACPGNFSGQGSTLSAPFFTNPNALLSSYQTVFPTPIGQAPFTYVGTGSSAGLTALLSGKVLYAGSDVPPTNAQVASNTNGNCTLLNFPILVFGVAIIYNIPGLTAQLQLTATQIAQIYTGVVTMWNDPRLVVNNPGLATIAQPITSVARSDGSGTTGNVTQFLELAATGYTAPVGNGPFPLYTASAQGFGNLGGSGGTVSGSAAMLSSVTSTSYSIGYIGLDYICTSTTPVAAIQNSSLNYITPSITSIEAAAAISTVPSDLRINLLNTPVANGYPITNVTNIVVFSCQPSLCIAQNLQNFLFYIATFGQSFANPLCFGTLPANIVSQYKRQIYDIQPLTYNSPSCNC